jgi:hypothetical protein
MRVTFLIMVLIGLMSTMVNDYLRKGVRRGKQLSGLCLKIACFWPTGGGQSRCVYVCVCVKLARAMQPIKLVPGKWLGKGNHR